MTLHTFEMLNVIRRNKQSIHTHRKQPFNSQAKKQAMALATL